MIEDIGEFEKSKMNEEELDEDTKWKLTMVENLANNIIEEKILKKKVIDIEQRIIEKHQSLEKKREKHLKFFEEKEEEKEKDRTLIINQYQKFCIVKLEQRIKYLQSRAEKLKNELKIANSSNGTTEPNMLRFMEDIQDRLHENKTLEKYIQSENFRIYDETILSLKYNLEVAKKKYKDLRKIRKNLKQSFVTNEKLLKRNQKKFQREID
jgi:hypothetical protein